MNLIRRYFERLHCYEHLVKVNAPECITEGAKKALNKVEASLNTDILTYLQTDEGKTAYFLYTVDEDQYEDARDKCESCMSYGLKGDADPFCIHFENFPVIGCQNYKNSGKDYFQRIFEAEDRCRECQHHRKEKQEDFNVELIRCKINRNMFNENCPDKKL